MSKTLLPPRVYNQYHKPRKYNAGKRRFSVYWAWSYPWEANRDLTELDNRFSTMTEVRRVAWPDYESTEWNKMNFLQSIDGTLELFHRSLISFQETVEEISGQPVAIYQRIDQAGYKLPIDERILKDTDTLMIFGLDHIASEQEASGHEISALKEWLKREGTCLILSPHHDVGFTNDLEQRQIEYKHHGDELVPRQQRFGLYTRSLMKALDVPVINQFGLRPARDKKTNNITPLIINKELDKLHLLKNVTTFNFHMHLPHYALTNKNTKAIHVLAKQPIDLSRPHPFIDAGNKDFNMFLWMPSNSTRAAEILLADSTIFTTLFGGTDSLKYFWRNLAKM